MPTSRARASMWALAALMLAAPMVTLPAGPAQAAVGIDWLRRASGLEAPTHVTSARDGTGRLFVTEKRGTVRIFRDGRLLERPFLDIRDRVRDAGEAGLLSIAFHPDYRRHPQLWVAFTTNGNNLRVARFTARSATANRVTASSSRRVITVRHPDHSPNPFAGQLAFDSSRMLLVSTGDGGGSGDPMDHAQDLGTLQGKLLRIQVLGARRGCGRPYCVPDDNPYAGSRPGKGQIWASGLRNAWRFSVDPVTGDLWVADVGQGAFEEVDRIPAGQGGWNLGWSCKEAFATFDADRCRAGADYRDPVVA